MSTTPLFKKIKKNGTTLYVFPGVTEDKNFETQNENYKMNISHFALVNFPAPTKEDIFNDTFNSNASSFSGGYADELVNSLRNYVANHEVTVRNTMTSPNTFYYDVFENYTITEKIFWKWAKKLGFIEFELATDEHYYMNDSKYDELGSTPDFQREYLWTERTNDIFGVVSITTGPGIDEITIQLGSETKFKVGDTIIVNVPNLDGAGENFSIFEIVAVTSDSETFDTITIDVDLDTGDVNDNPTISDFGDIDDLEISNAYDRFIQFMSEITGVNNAQLPDRTYTEAYAYIAHQQGMTPYLLWRTMVDNNYKPNSKFPILPNQIQQEIQGGENANNPILTNPSNYPGDIWAQFDEPDFTYQTASGDTLRRIGDYFGNNNINNTNINPIDFTPDTIDGLTLDLNIDNYKKAKSHLFPIETFKEFAATSFDQEAPKDFDFNAILWFYTIEDVSGENVEYATNLYGIEFLDSPENSEDKVSIPTQQKLVTNGYQDGNSYTFSLDTNITVESYTDTHDFDPNKIYSLFGMELYYEALTRITYMNDQLGQILGNHSSLRNEIETLRGMIYTQESIDSIKAQINNLKSLLNVYSTLQIGDSDTIIAELDTSVSPALVRLHSVDKRYGNILHYYTQDMFNEFQNSSSLTEITPVIKNVPIKNGKDFLVVVNNNDNNVPSSAYDDTIIQDKLKLVIEKDLHFKQSLDILVLPTKSDIEVTTSGLGTPPATNKTQEPINDKELDLFINFNDGSVTSELKIKTLSLPVTKYLHSDDSFYDEPAALFETVPTWPVKNVYYDEGSSTNKRKFTFVVEADLIHSPKLKQNMRFFLKNFMLEYGSEYMDLSKQYQIMDSGVNIRQSKIEEVILTGSGDTYNVGDICDIEYLNPNSNTYVVGKIEVISITPTNGIDEFIVINNNLLNNQHNLDTINNKLEITVGSNPGSTPAYCIIREKIISEVSIEFDIINSEGEIPDLLDIYDTLYKVETNGIACIDDKLKTMPTLTFLKGTMISITRISDAEIILAEDIAKRYRIDIKML